MLLRCVALIIICFEREWFILSNENPGDVPGSLDVDEFLEGAMVALPNLMELSILVD